MLHLLQAKSHIYQILPMQKQHLKKKGIIRTKWFQSWPQQSCPLWYILTINIGDKVYGSKIQNNFDNIRWIHDQHQRAEDCHSSLYETKKTRENHTLCFVVIGGSIKSRKRFHSYMHTHKAHTKEVVFEIEDYNQVLDEQNHMEYSMKWILHHIICWI